MFNRIVVTMVAIGGSLFGKINAYQYRFEGLFEDANDHSRYGLIEKIIDLGDTLLEAGGFDGGDTIHLAKLVPQGRVISFEPNPSRFQELVEKTKDLSNVQAYPLALGSNNETITFHLCHGLNANPAYDGASSILPPSEAMEANYQGPDIEVPCVVLDDWCHDHYVDRIDFMWLDLEGYELQVLQSSPQLLKTVKAMYVETNFFEFRKGMTLYQDLKTFLENQGFRLLSHWYYEGYQGNAVFVRADLFDEIIEKIQSKSQK